MQDGLRELAARPVGSIPGIGRAFAASLSEAGLGDVGALWFHFPLRYEDRTAVTSIAALKPKTQAQFEGVVEEARVMFRRRRTLLVGLFDGSGRITLRFFHFTQAQAEQFKVGARVLCFGEPKPGLYNLEVVHPRYKILGAEEALALAQELTPVYPQPAGIGTQRIQKAVQAALALLPADADLEMLPAEWLSRRQWPSLASALRVLHRPASRADAEAIVAGKHPARERLAFEELLAHHLSLRLRRERLRQDKAPVLRGGAARRTQLEQALPFALTAAQRRVLDEIDRDLARRTPMLRLVQGDVGSGKTVVAALAALRVVDSGLQCAIMAPTELLAEQHRRNFARWFDPLGIDIVWLASKLRVAEKREALARIQAGAPIVIGTHALLQEGVQYRGLGLSIVDEQHRFGVHQRLLLREKGAIGDLRPHQLVLTATPIPRTLAMTQFADLDVSVIDELPPGRKPIVTVTVSQQRRDEVVARIGQQCAAGRQAYWVCTLIEESDEVEAEAAEATAADLSAALPGLRIGLAHGRMKSNERATVMANFAAGELDLLVATTVIEVGVDVPNASLMVIDNAERLGLAQLHQLRGRVGRGSQESSCVLLYKAPLSEMARERLAALRETTDGFRIAERDLALRGPGEVLGTRQTGMASFKVADLARDAELLAAVRDLATRLLSEQPALASALVERWVGGAARFAQA
mgnify:FL=1